MIILLVLGVLVVVGLLIVGYGDAYSDMRTTGTIISVISGFILFLFLIGIPISHMESRSGIQQFEAVRSTVESARANGIPMESAAIQIKVAEMNQWLAEQQYYRTTIFSVWYPEEVMDLEPIR